MWTSYLNREEFSVFSGQYEYEWEYCPKGNETKLVEKQAVYEARQPHDLEGYNEVIYIIQGEVVFLNENPEGEVYVNLSNGEVVKLADCQIFHYTDNGYGRR
jgi:hypothetical protein